MVSNLYIAAKPPIPGLVKTRLARGIGTVASARLYAAFLDDLAAEVRAGEVCAGWFIPAGSSWSPPPLGPLQLPTRWQVGSSWSARQSRLFEECHRDESRGLESHRDGRPGIVLMASDSPQLTAAEIVTALTEGDEQVVLGPVHDGGYYLLGMRGFHDILRGVEMSTASVCGDIISRATGRGVKVRLLPPQFDVDEVGDLPLLEAAAEVLPHLRATRRALAAIRHSHVAAGPG
jgi:uncharacterized protein